MEDTMTLMTGNGTSHNILWSDEFDAYFGMLFPLVMGLILGLLLAFQMAVVESNSTEQKRLWQDVALFSFLALCEEAILWVYIFMAPYFVSSGEMQIAMFVIFFAGPPIVSSLLLAPWTACTTFSCVSVLEFREEVLNNFGVSNELISCDSVSGLLFPIKYILAHIAFVMCGLFVILFFGICSIALMMLGGLLALFVLQGMIKTQTKEENESWNISPVDLLHCILIHLISFSIPEMIMVLLNINLPSTHESEGLTIALIVFVSLECVFGIFYLVKCIRMCHRQSTPTQRPSFGVEEAPRGNDGVQMTGTSSSFVPTMPIRKSTGKLEAEFSTTAAQGNQIPAKTLEDNNDDDLEEPSWINPSRYSSYQGDESTQPSVQRHVTLRTGSLRNHNHGFVGQIGSDALECPICYIAGNKKKVIIACGHMMCEHCLEGLQRRTGPKLCPFCHQQILQTTDLYF